jgi:hypothetical protein
VVTARRVTVVADDVLPRPGESGRAAGMRAWAIGEGLRANGLTVRYAIRTHWWPAGRPLPPPREIERYWNSAAELEQALDAFDPEVLVNCSYPSVLTRRASERIVVQDVNGPRLLEGAFWEPASLERSAWREVTAYASADYFVCAGERQLAFFYPWLALSGFDLTEKGRIQAVRIGIAGPAPERRPVLGRLLAAGSLLPWTDPRRAWRTALDETRESGGTLRLLVADRPGDGRTAFLREEVERLRREVGCEVRDAVPWEEFTAELASASAALDVMQRNGERDLAVPTRTLACLWAGLPPIVGDYGELAELIVRYDAGWAVAPDDEVALRGAVREALTDPGALARKSANARRLHDAQLRPELAARELAALCAKAMPRPGKRFAADGRVRRALADRAFRLARRLALLAGG